MSKDWTDNRELKGDERLLLRDVWEQLESANDYSHFARRYLKNLKENQDFGVYGHTPEKSTGGRPRKDHWVTVDVAKLIAMQTPQANVGD